MAGLATNDAAQRNGGVVGLARARCLFHQNGNGGGDLESTGYRHDDALGFRLVERTLRAGEEFI
ncbi:hypothetical protein VQ03_30810 [Methylobacterium tarhaniae]|uniref:Uncharacterized protein n=1 Tax=Methylobacterium tarhaniae TaxID=1187852 RepID=A0A0J6UM82_9HYPH|nr:hypothetical protein VQ03_30810 [Methylobacterium tarhaniae]